MTPSTDVVRSTPDRQRRGKTARRATLCCAALAAAAGCQSNPFATYERDYGERVPAETLRSVDSIDMDRFKKPPSPPPEDPVAEARKRFEGKELVALTLVECRASALENNLELKVAVIDPAIARELVSEEEARFESAFTLRAVWADIDSATASSLDSAQAESGSLRPGVRIPMRTGGTAFISLPMSRNETDNAFSTLNPSYTADAEFSISHELLRGAGRRSNMAFLRIASYEEQASEARTKLEAIRQLAAVDRSYWRLFQARRELDVRLQQYDLAKAQLERAQRRVRTGLSAEIEVIRAESGVAERLEAIIIAQNLLLLRQRELKRVVNMPGLDVSTQTMVDTTTPPDPVAYLFDPGVLTNQAVANRMEMLELELRLAADAATIDLNRNQTLPLLTLDYTYRINGLGGNSEDAFDSLFDSRFVDMELGLNAEIPLGNEAARSRLRRSILERLQRLSSREAREQTIRQEVLNAVDVIDASWQRILAARYSVTVATRSFQAEQRQFEVGNSTSTDVLDAASRLAEAQSDEIRALTDYQIAQVDLAFSTGTLLGAGKVDWEPADRPKTDVRVEETLPSAHPVQPPPADPAPPPPTIEPPAGG